jgi:NAD+ diphosphatase
VLRKKPEEIAKLLDAAGTRLLPLWRNRNWIARGEPMRPGYLEAVGSGELLRGIETVFLGERDGRALFAVDLPGHDDTPKREELGGGDFNDLRLCGGRLDSEDFGQLGYARALLHWHRHHRHCGSCGAPTVSEEGGHVRSCSACGQKNFPRTDPAIMSLVTRGDRCLLARQPSWPKGMFSALAGFVEPGETLEQAVVRETAEEVGVSVSEVHYLRSQPWPFPCSLMIGFQAEADSDDFRVDGEEIEEARWLTREQLRDPDGFFIPPPFSLAHQLIAWFIEH